MKARDSAIPSAIHLPIGTYVPEFVANDVENTGFAPEEDKGADCGTVFQEGFGVAVAVMPIHALTGDPADESFADGLTDELIFALERAKGLRITSRNITFQYKNQSRSQAEIAAELKVDAVLQGTLRREDDFTGLRSKYRIRAASSYGLTALIHPAKNECTCRSVLPRHSSAARNWTAPGCVPCKSVRARSRWKQGPKCIGHGGLLIYRHPAPCMTPLLVFAGE